MLTRILRSRADDSATRLQVLWYINGYPVANDATHKMLINEAGNNALMITGASQRDSGTVTCVARNKSGEVSHQVSAVHERRKPRAS